MFERQSYKERFAYLLALSHNGHAWMGQVIQDSHLSIRVHSGHLLLLSWAPGRVLEKQQSELDQSSEGECAALATRLCPPSSSPGHLPPSSDLHARGPPHEPSLTINPKDKNTPFPPNFAAVSDSRARIYPSPTIGTPAEQARWTIDTGPPVTGFLR